MATNPTSEGLTKTKVFEMYMDGAKWLLAIIAALLVFGFDQFKDERASRVGLALFQWAAVFLTLAAGSALFYLLQSYSYASRRATAGDAAGSAPAAAGNAPAAAPNAPAAAGSGPTAAGNAPAAAGSKSKGTRQQKRIDLAWRLANGSFTVLILSFSLGGLLYLAFAAVRITSLGKESKPLQVHAGTRTPVIQRGDRIWVLRRVNGVQRWVRLPDVPQE